MPFDIVGLIVGLIGAATALVGTGVNYASQTQTNQENKEYANQMTTAQWKRDDTSLQRQVEDAKKAGLSPLAVTGAMNTSSPLNYVGQAPQMDLSSLVGLASSSSNALFSRAEGRETREQQSNNLDKQLTYNLYALEKSIQKDKDLQQNEFAQELLTLGKQLAYQYDVLNEQSSSHAQDLDSDRLIEISRQSMDTYNSITQSLGMAPRTEYVSDLKTYTEMYNSFMVKYNNFLQDWRHVDMGSITSSNESESMGSSVLHTGVQFSSASGKQYESKTALLHDMFSVYFSDAVLPIFVDNKPWTSRTYNSN